MRLDKNIGLFLKNKTIAIAPGSKIFLFGSRADDNAKGGDIDILILSFDKLQFKDLRDIRISFYKEFGEQKIDLVNFTFDENDTFKELIMPGAIEL